MLCTFGMGERFKITQTISGKMKELKPIPAGEPFPYPKKLKRKEYPILDLCVVPFQINDADNIGQWLPNRWVGAYWSETTDGPRPKPPGQYYAQGDETGNFDQSTDNEGFELLDWCTIQFAGFTSQDKELTLHMLSSTSTFVVDGRRTFVEGKFVDVSGRLTVFSRSAWCPLACIFTYYVNVKSFLKYS